jgi:hypothetical protein
MRNIFLASAAAATVVAGLGIGAPAFAQSGSYAGSCRNTQSSNGVLTAECADSQGRFHMSSIPFGQCRGDIGNNNGMLTCNGANATGGQIVGGGDNNNRGRNNNGNAAGAAAAGVVAGALLGGALAGNGPPPAYGDPRYGDPRYDSRYAQGGWGYGHRTGEWVPIRERADWLSQRIDRALRDGRLGRDDARDLRRELNRIEDMESRYMRDRHLGPGERADLDHRFDELSNRIRYEAGPADRRNDRR